VSRRVLIDSKLWNDPWVLDKLTPQEKLLFLYLITNDRGNIIGIYEISLRTIANEVGFERVEVEQMLAGFGGKVAYVDGWIVLKNALKNQNYHSPKIQAAVKTVCEKVPDGLLKHIDWPADYGKEKPKGSVQTSLLDNKNEHNVAQSSMKQHDDLSTTETGVGYGMHTVSHTNANTNANANPRPSGHVATEAAVVVHAPKVRKVEIDEMLDYWADYVGYKIEARIKQNRFAVSNLLKKHGEDKLKRLVDGVVLAKQDRFAPSIADFAQLQQKYNDLMAWGHKRQINGTEVIS
jgi:hypothetical protein